MGGVVKSVGNVIGGVGGLASGAVGAIPGVGKVLGPIASGITGGPLGFASSLAFNAATGQYSGGGGSSTPMYAQPNINYGNNTYQFGGTPIDTSPYFISGDKGVYNLLPAFGQVNAGTTPPNDRIGLFGTMFRQNNPLGKQGAYTPYEAYNDVLSKMAGDQKAIDAFKAAYTPSAPINKFPILSKLPTPYGPYVNYNLNQNVPGQTGLTYKQLADYAAKQKNPFFMPYQTTQGATAMGFTPSESALAPVDLKAYRTQLQQAIRDQFPYRGLFRRPGTSPVTSNPVTPNPVTPNPVTPNPVTPNPVTPNPVTPNPVTPTPVIPSGPGNFVPMARGGIAALRRR